jgi:hypothetical protein
MTDLAVPCHFGEREAPKALMHDPKGGLAVGHHQLDVRVFFGRVVGIGPVKLFAAQAWLDNVAVGRERIICEVLRSD